jgi:hypothetical protein
MELVSQLVIHLVMWIDRFNTDVEIGHPEGKQFYCVWKHSADEIFGTKKDKLIGLCKTLHRSRSQ